MDPVGGKTLELRLRRSEKANIFKEGGAQNLVKSGL